jgi:hypothetical protein
MGGSGLCFVSFGFDWIELDCCEKERGGTVF